MRRAFWWSVVGEQLAEVLQLLHEQRQVIAGDGSPIGPRVAVLVRELEAPLPVAIHRQRARRIEAVLVSDRFGPFPCDRVGNLVLFWLHREDGPKERRLIGRVMDRAWLAFVERRRGVNQQPQRELNRLARPGNGKVVRHLWRLELIDEFNQVRVVGVLVPPKDRGSVGKCAHVSSLSCWVCQTTSAVACQLLTDFLGILVVSKS